MNRLTTKFLVCAAVCLLLPACAALFSGSSEMVDFTSDPSGAKVYVNGVLKGRAPVRLKLQKKHTYDVEFRMAGYDPVTTAISNSVGGGWVVLDILGGLLPVVIDAATGSWYSLDQDHVNAAFDHRDTNLFEKTSFFENQVETRLPNFRAAMPQAAKYSDSEIIQMFMEKFPRLRQKTQAELIELIEAKYATD